MRDYLNSNGLQDGKIPMLKECPFLSGCKLKTENCPSVEEGNLRKHGFSCGAARMFSMIICSRMDKGEDTNIFSERES